MDCGEQAPFDLRRDLVKVSQAIKRFASSRGPRCSSSTKSVACPSRRAVQACSSKSQMRVAKRRDDTYFKQKLRRMGRHLRHPVVATALLDRLLHHAAVVRIEGASYRLRKRKKSVKSIAQESCKNNSRKAEQPGSLAFSWSGNFYGSPHT